MHQIRDDGSEFCATIWNSGGRWQARYWIRDSHTKESIRESDIQPCDCENDARDWARRQAYGLGFRGKIKITRPKEHDVNPQKEAD